MELGEKLRQARTALGLSQRQLCGEEITRNMLSQIESGKARPSMSTLQYLAARLDKPVGYFLEDGDCSPSDAALEKARQAFAAGDHAAALDFLENCQGNGAEKGLLEYLCLVELGRNAMTENKLPYARQLLGKAGNIETIYRTAALDRERQLLLLDAGENGTIPVDDRALLLQAQQALEKNEPGEAVRFLNACSEETSRWALLRGKAALLEGAPKAAFTYLQKAERDFPKQAVPLLEQCCKELEDYKQAYYYACLQR